jgi:arginine/serine-rich splicing factor 4/5/6
MPRYDYKVYVGNLPDDVSERELEKVLKPYGRYDNIVLKGNYAFVEFEDERDAADAVKDLDGAREFGNRLRLEHAKDSKLSGRRRSPPRRRGNPPGRKTGYRVIVENMSTKTSWQDLKDFMRQCGEITYTNAHNQRPGEGIVEFGSHDDMDYALDKLDGEELDGKRIRLLEEKRRSASRSRSRSRKRKSRSRTRSRSPRSKSRSRSRT